MLRFCCPRGTKQRRELWACQSDPAGVANGGRGIEGFCDDVNVWLLEANAGRGHRVFLCSLAVDVCGTAFAWLLAFVLEEP